MAGVNQVLNFVGKYTDDVAKFVALKGDDTVDIFCRQAKPIKPAGLKALRFAPEAIGDITSFTTKSAQNKLRNLCESFLEQLYECKPYPEEVDILFKNINRNSSNLKLSMKRFQTIRESKDYLSLMLCERNLNNSGFLIDNIDKINSIISCKVRRKIGLGADKIFEILGEKELSLLASCGDDTEKIVKLAKQMIYDSKPHNINFGQNIRVVDSSDVVAIVSGNQSLSYFETGSSKTFENTVLELAEITKPEKGQQYYYKIAEGILKQRPDLVKIVDELNTTIETSSLPIKETLTDFFRNKAKSGELPRTITLKTIVPDENALILPKDTFNIFKSRL